MSNSIISKFLALFKATLYIEVFFKVARVILGEVLFEVFHFITMNDPNLILIAFSSGEPIELLLDDFCCIFEKEFLHYVACFVRDIIAFELFDLSEPIEKRII